MFMLRVITAGEQRDTVFANEADCMKAFNACRDLALVFKDSALFAWNSAKEMW